MPNTPLAGTNPLFPGTIQGFGQLNMGEMPPYLQNAQKEWAARQQAILAKGGDTAAALGMATSGKSPSEMYLESLLRREESAIARQGRKEDINALIEQKRAFDKEKSEREFKYNMLASIPQTISQSFGNIAAMNLAAGQGIADTYARTLGNYPRPNFTSFNYQPQKYFE